MSALIYFQIVERLNAHMWLIVILGIVLLSPKENVVHVVS